MRSQVSGLSVAFVAICTVVAASPHFRSHEEHGDDTLQQVTSSGLLGTAVEYGLGILNVLQQPSSPEPEMLKAGNGASSPPLPVVILPGTGGSQLEAKLNKATTSHWYCSKKSGWYRIWLSVTQLLPGAIDCWIENIALQWHEDSDSYTNAEGVETRVPGFGDTSTIENIDPDVPFGAASYWKTVVDKLVDLGLERGHTVRGAPYDFRRAPTDEYVDDLRQLIEETFTNAGGRRVVLMSHSMGCLYSLFFLNHMTDEWKSKYVSSWMPVAGVFAGSANEIQLFASGNNEGVPVAALKVRGEQRTYESNFWMLPSPRWFGEDFVMARVGDREYHSTTESYKDFFDGIGFPEGYRQWERVSNLTSLLSWPFPTDRETESSPASTNYGDALPTPHRVHHFYGLGVKTPESMEWESKSGTASDFEIPPKTVNMGDGDGTVNAASLKSVEKAWSAQSNSGEFVVHTFEGASHSGILKDKQFLEELRRQLLLRSDEEREG